MGGHYPGYAAAAARPPAPSAARTAARSVGAPAGETTARSPNLAASSARRSGWATERSSPVSPTSPKQASGAGLGRDAARGARDRERDRQVGPRLLDAHAADDVDEDVAGAHADARVAREHGEDERQAVAVEPGAHAPRRHELARRDERLDLDEQRSRALHRREHDAPRRARGLAHEARARVEDLDEAALAHLEDADVVGRPEAVLERAQRAVRALALALELQHAVDEVLEHARAREGALLRDVPDEHDRGALALGHVA